MTNVLKNKRKTCIEWSVKLPSDLGSRIVSESFLLQSENCYLEFHTEFVNRGNRHDKPCLPTYPPLAPRMQLPMCPPCLRFNCSGKLQLPIKATLHIVMDSNGYSRTNVSITNTNQIIWSDTTNYQLTNRHMFFELIFHDDYLDDKCLQTASYINGPMRGLTEDFSKLLESTEDHDVVMKCGENTIKTHKLLLSTRSDVFRTMLQTNILKSRTGVIEIQEMDDSYFQEFTRYLYTDEMPELTFEKAKALYLAGDKYNIQSLVLRCAEYLEDILCSENAFEIYVLADTHSNEKLKESVKAYLLEEEVYLQSEHWMQFYENFPKLALEVYRLSHEKDTPKRKKSKKIA